MSSAAESGQKKDKVISGLAIAIMLGLRQEIDVLKGQTIDQLRKRELLDLSMPLPATSKSKKKKKEKKKVVAHFEDRNEDFLRVCAVHISKYELLLRETFELLKQDAVSEELLNVSSWRAAFHKLDKDTNFQICGVKNDIWSSNWSKVEGDKASVLWQYSYRSVQRAGFSRCYALQRLKMYYKRSAEDEEMHPLSWEPCIHFLGTSACVREPFLETTKPVPVKCSLGSR